MSETLQTEYSDCDGNAVDITYNEKTDKWEFILRGRSRSADTLGKAKEYIAKVPADKTEAKAFTPREAILGSGYGNSRYQRVTVTSIAEGEGYSSTKYFWIKDSKGARSKESNSSLFEDNTHNADLIRKIRQNDKDIEKINEENRTIVSGLEKLQF